MHALDFQRTCHQSGSSLRSFFFCNQLGYGAVTSLTFHLRFCFCFRSHLKTLAMFFLLSSTSTRQLMPFRAEGEEHRRQLTAHPGISLSLVREIFVRSAFPLFCAINCLWCCTKLCCAEHPEPVWSCPG